jgi:transcriptional regulator with XRE-family HTH domain
MGKIDEYRKDRGLSLKDLSDKAWMSLGRLNEIRNGDFMSNEEACNLAEALKTKKSNITRKDGDDICERQRKKSRR